MADIQTNLTQDVVTAGFLTEWKARDATNRGAQVASDMLDFLFGMRAIQYAVPTTGQTVTVLAGKRILIVNPAGTLVSLTISMPPDPVDGQDFTVAVGQIITSVTFSGGTLVGAVSSLALGGYCSHIYNSTAGKWFRAG